MRYAIIVFAAISAWWAPLAAQSCASPSDTTSIALVARMKALVTSTHTEQIYVRRSVQIPGGDSSTVTLVTQNQTCSKALTAFNSTIVGHTPLPTKIYLAKVGTVYVAMYPVPGEHLDPWATIDSKFKVLAKFAQ